jgi:ABC-type transport system involved in multi-copper enzyme maturation permease subunit
VFGAIFLQEMLVAGRRQRLYFLRWVWAAILLVQLAPRILVGLMFERERPGSSAMGVFVQFFDSFTAQHFFYLLILTPALTAGAIADEKMRGTLDYLLTTCLNPSEIVLGKLLARVCQILVLTLVVLPMICFFGVIGDLNLSFVAALFVASAVLVLGVGALSLLASVLCRRTRDAILCTYLVLFAGYCALGAVSAAGWDGPAEAFSPWHAASQEREGRWGRLALFAVAWLVPAAGCVALASWRLRPAAVGQVSQAARAGWGWRRLRTIPENANPVLWRERRVQGIAPLARLRAVPVWLAAPALALICALGLAVPIFWQLPDGVDLAGAFAQDGIVGVHETFRMNGVRGWDVASAHGGIALFVLTLLVAVRASGAFTEERERATWDAVMLSPLSTHEVVRGKFWGLHAAWAPYFIAYAGVSLPLAFFVSPQMFLAIFLATGAMLVYAPWIAAVGLLCSACMHSSWRSLLSTLGVCYAYYLFLAPMLLIPSCIVSSFVAGLVMFIVMGAGGGRGGGNPMGNWFEFVFMLALGGTMLLLNAAIVWPASYGLLKWAHARIDKAERARVTRNEQEYMQMIPRLDRLAEELAAEERDRRS